MFDDFRRFLNRGNILQLATGLVLGLAFATVVKSFVDDVLMPPIGLLLGGMDFSDLFVVLKEGTAPARTLEEARAVGAVTLNYGAFINNLVSFLIVAAAVYSLLKAAYRAGLAKEEKEVPTRECPYCLASVPTRAIRCPQCTSDLKPEVTPPPGMSLPRPTA